MAPKRGNVTASAGAGSTASVASPAKASPASVSTSISASPNSFDKVVLNLWDNYVRTTSQRTKLLDVFMAFLVVVGALQFAYCILAGNYVRFASGTPRRLS